MNIFRKWVIFADLAEKCENVWRLFFWNFEVWAVQKHVNLVDIGKSFPTNIFLQNLASIQKRTSPIEFAHLAEKSENGSIPNLSTKVRNTATTGTCRVISTCLSRAASKAAPKSLGRTNLIEGTFWSMIVGVKGSLPQSTSTTRSSLALQSFLRKLFGMIGCKNATSQIHLPQRCSAGQKNFSAVWLAALGMCGKYSKRLWERWLREHS